MIQFNNYLDQIFSEFSKPEYTEMMNRSKVQFIDFAGSFDEDNLDIEAKWSQFRDWFLFLYAGDIQNSLPSALQIMASEKFQMEVDIPKEIMTSILNSKLSVFQHRKSYKDQIKVRDLISRYKHYVMEQNAQLILERKDYIQTRIFHYENKFYFSGSFVVHPPLARKYIDSKIKLLKKEKNKDLKPENEKKFLENILKMYYRALRFKQVEIQKVYSDQPLFERRPQVSL